MNFYDLPAAWAEYLRPFLFNHLWQATLFAFVVWIAVGAMRKAPARARHLAWLLALAKFVIPSALLVLPVSLLRPRPTPEIVPTPVPVAATRFSSAADTGVKIMFQLAQPLPQHPVIPVVATANSRPWPILIFIIWLVGATLVLGRWIIRRWRLSRSLRAEPRLTSGREADALKRAMAWLAIRREIGLIVSPRVTEPGVWRSIRPVILLPEGLVERLNDQELEAVMMHELFHILHRDNLIGAVQMIVCGILWFHPVIWWIDRRLLAEREVICDEQVVRLNGKPEVYAAGLWKAAQFGLGWPVAGLSQAAGSNLKRRIERMLSADFQLNHRPRRRIVAGAIIGLLIVAALSFGLLAGPGALARDARNGQSSQNLLLDGDPASGIAGEVSEGISGEVEGGATGGVASMVGFKGSMKQVVDLPSDWQDRLNATPAQTIRFENVPGKPIAITDARVRVVDLGGYYAVNSIVTLEGQSERAIEIASIQHCNQQSSAAINDETSYLDLRRGQSASINKTWFIAGGSVGILDDYQQNLTVKITSMRFIDETTTEK